MKKRLLLFSGVVAAITLITGGLNAIPVKKQQQRITLTVSTQEADLILKALAELPLKESGNLYISIQQQAQAQLQAVSPLQKPKSHDSTTAKPKKP